MTLSDLENLRSCFTGNAGMIRITLKQYDAMTACCVFNAQAEPLHRDGCIAFREKFKPPPPQTQVGQKLGFCQCPEVGPKVGHKWVLGARMGPKRRSKLIFDPLLDPLRNLENPL